MKTRKNASKVISDALYQKALAAARSLAQLEELYLLLRGSGLKDALAADSTGVRPERLNELIERMRGCERALDWELTGEIVRLKELVLAYTADFARIRYGIIAGANLRLPGALPDLPDNLKARDLTVIDEPPHELRVTGNPVRGDGTLVTETVELLIGPEVVKVWIAGQARRTKLRSRVHR